MEETVTLRCEPEGIKVSISSTLSVQCSLITEMREDDEVEQDLPVYASSSDVELFKKIFDPCVFLQLPEATVLQLDIQSLLRLMIVSGYLGAQQALDVVSPALARRLSLDPIGDVFKGVGIADSRRPTVKEVTEAVIANGRHSGLVLSGPQVD